MKQRIYEACILKHSIKKGILSVVGKMNLFGSAMVLLLRFIQFGNHQIFSKHSPRPTLSFKFQTILFTKHVTFNNFSKLLYQSIIQQIFPSNDIVENAGTINISPVSWFKSKASPQSLLKSRPHLFPFTQKWWTLPLQHFFELQFFVISCSNVCRTTVSWYITPTTTPYIFSNLRHTILNPNFQIFCRRLNPIQSNLRVRPTSSIPNFNLNRQCFP